MPAPIALQLYTLREAMAQDFEGVVRNVAEIGYVGVEPAGFPGTTPAAAAQLFKELGLEVTSAHCPLPVGEKKQESLEIADALGLKRIVSGFGRDHFSTLDKIKATCDQFNEASENAAEKGMTFGIHNHWWEYLKVEGRYAYQVMQEHLKPEVFFQVDAYWVQTAGPDPAGVLRELGARAPLVHVKDGPCVKEEPMQALGEGITDFKSLVDAGQEHVEWWIVELDRCATDMMEAVVKSYQYMIEKGFARGNKS
ncbi:MAG: sugar phosphate isomerase/epimerase [bacterium]|nr:sugar phosphate isomerase/epimerase [bacterium]